MKKFIVQEAVINEYHVIETHNEVSSDGENATGGKQLIGIFRSKDEAQFHADIRNKHLEMEKGSIS